MTWKEVLESGAKTVTVLSYGYEQLHRCFGSHFEPFSKKRSFKFKIRHWSDGSAYLDHEWLCLNEREDRLDFDRDSDTGEITLYDPDLYAIPDLT